MSANHIVNMMKTESEESDNSIESFNNLPSVTELSQVDMYSLIGENIFKNKKYTQNINPINHYIEQCATALHKDSGDTMATCRKFIIDTLKLNKEIGIKNPKVKYYERDDKTGDKEVKISGLVQYLSTTLAEADIIVPSYTTYINHEKKTSFQVDYIFSNVLARSKFKKKAFEYKSMGDVENFTYYNILQKRKKISNNSVSGSYASKGTIMYNPSAHYSLTSITRCVASLGNATAESMIAGNRHYSDLDTIRNHLTSMITITNHKSVEVSIIRFKLKIPSVDDVMNMITYSSDLYFKNPEGMQSIREYVETFTDTERAIVTYVNDLYHLRVHNPKIVRAMMKAMSTKHKGISKEPLKDVKKVPEHILNLTHHILTDELKGKKIDYAQLAEDDTLDYLVSTSINAMYIMKHFERLFKSFFVTDNIPLGVAYLPKILRRVTVLSDTDSTCATYQEWVQWYFGDNRFDAEAIGVSAAVMTMVTQVLDHILNQFSKNMGIGDKYLYLLAMKNEFYWNVMTPMDVSKHYFADTLIQEGVVFSESELEKKGAHIIASKIPDFAREKAEKLMIEISSTVVGNRKLKLKEIAHMVADMERLIIEKATRGDTDILQTEKINIAKSYKLTPNKSPYRNYTMWKMLFEDRYGTPGEPPYLAVKVPVTTDKKRTMREFIDGLEDKELASKYREYLDHAKMDAIGTYRLPITIAKEKGIPSELIPILNIDKLLEDNLNIFYMLLRSIGLFKQDSVKLMDMGY